jgi:DsbC/DsbD-like thiol-disulfide interchange protein
MKKLLFTVFLSAAFVLALGASFAKAQTVGINGSIGAVKRGGSARGKITMAIPNGLHANSNRPGSEYAIPTVVKVSASGARVSAVSYPRGTSRRFGFSDEALNVYEGNTAFGFNLSVPANFKGSTVKVRATVRYQTCSDQVCYPPKTQEITFTAQVK